MAEQKTEELTEEAKLAQEALDATPESPAEEPVKREDMVPATVVAKQRARARTAELNAARLQGENEALKAAGAKPEKSPMEMAAEEQECSMDEIQMTGKLYREQQAFEQRHATAQSERETYERQTRDYDEGLATIDQTEREELIARGGHLLTEGDKRNIWDAGRKSGQELKRILTFRIKQDQPEEKTKTDKSKEAEEKAKGKKDAEEEVPSQEEILSSKTLDAEYKKLSFEAG